MCVGGEKSDRASQEDLLGGGSFGLPVLDSIKSHSVRPVLCCRRENKEQI